MDDPTASGPICQKCDQPMVWHSAQPVQAGGEQQTMHVFQCEACERLTAVAGSSVRAA